MNYSVQITQQIALLRSAAAFLEIIDCGEKPWSQSDLNALVEAFAAVGSTDKLANTRNFPPGFHNWLVYYIAKQRTEALYGGAAAELSRAAISDELTNAMRRAGWLK